MYSLKFLILFFLSFLIFQGSNAQELSVFQGILNEQYYEDDQRITKKEFESLLKSNPRSNELLKKSKIYHTVSGIGSIAFAISFPLYVFTDPRNPNSPILGLVALGSSFSVLVASKTSMLLRRNAILNYNSTFDVGIGVGQNGVGLVIDF